MTQAAAEAPPAEPKTTPTPPTTPADGDQKSSPGKERTEPTPPTPPEPEKKAPAAAEAPQEEGEEEEVSIEAVIDGEKRTLSGAEAVEYMNSVIERAVEIHEATRRANIARLEHPLASMVDELAAGKFEGDRVKAGQHLLGLMEQALLEHLEDQDRPEAERKARDLQAELEAAKAKLAQAQKAQEEEEWRDRVADAAEQIATDFRESFKALELEPDDDLKGIVVERMLAQRRRGLNPTVRGVMEKVKNELDARAEAVIGRRKKADEKSAIEAVRKSREEESAAPQKAPPKDGPERGYVLRDRDFLKD